MYHTPFIQRRISPWRGTNMEVGSETEANKTNGTAAKMK